MLNVALIIIFLFILMTFSRDPNIRSKNTTIFHNKFMNDTILMDQWLGTLFPYPTIFLTFLVSPLSYLQWLGSFNMLPNLLRFAENGVRTYAILRKLTGTQRLGVLGDFIWLVFTFSGSTSRS